MSLKSSTRWLQQWKVLSSNGKKEYVVSQCEDKTFACSCPNWTRNMPREECKHILRQRLTMIGTSIILSPNSVLTIKQVSGRKFR